MPLTAETQSRIRFALASNPAGAELINAITLPLFDPGNTVYTGTGNFVMAGSQIVAFVKKGTGAATQVTLPASPTASQLAVVIDAKGDAATNNITIVPAAGTIDGAASVLIQTNYGAISFIYNGTEWNVSDAYNMGGGSNLTLPGYLYETAQDNLTAFSGGGQGSATPIITQTSRVTTVAAPGDSVLLPPSIAGLELLVINHGANAMQVFGSGTDTIDDVATATGVSQMKGSVCIYTCATAGAWYSEGLGTGYSGALQTISFINNLTAHSGGGQGSALPVTASLSRFTVVAAPGDSVKLPVSAPGLVVSLINSGANPMQVYGAGTDTINGVATATGVSQMQNSIVNYACPVAGLWFAEGIGGGFAGSLETQSVTNGITAFATGGQGSATPLTSMINRITVCATTGDSVKLPISVAGMVISVLNAGAASLNVFPGVGDFINLLAVNTALAVPSTKGATFYCAVTGTWHAVLGS
jgi:hypothetical protein